ncbi:MAG: hypothetical protein M3Z16_08275 [Pseudomonadota bacterium]|nr:hypothetical protein [Pseudomonadota bacterium]
MAGNEGGGGSGGAIYCKVGGSTTVVDSAGDCSLLGGTVVPPPKPPGKVCGGCGVAMAQMAKSLGWGSGNLVDAARSFLELAMKATPVGKEMFAHMARIDEHFNEAVTRNPRVLGSVIAAFAEGSTFVRLITKKPGGPLDETVCPRVTYHHIQSTYAELAKGHDDRAFQEALAYLTNEFRLWEKATVRQLRERYLGTKKS